MGLVAALIFFFLSLWFHFRRAAREAEVAAS
jgi:cbb3-type cytochrome oxidase subunit 3